jgi:hypothetical protein
VPFGNDEFTIVSEPGVPPPLLAGDTVTVNAPDAEAFAASLTVAVKA